MNFQIIPGVVLRSAILCLSAVAAHAASVTYSFSGTTYATWNQPSHSEVFQMTIPDFLLDTANGPLMFESSAPEVESCSPCRVPPGPALVFLRGATDDLIQFLDADGTGRLYWFPLNAISTAGTWESRPGINMNSGTLVVTVDGTGDSAVPEPSTVTLVAAGCAAALAGARLRRASV